MTIDVFGFVFRIYNCLIFIQSIVSGNGITDGDSDQIIGNSTESKQLECDQDRGDRAVGNTTEKSRHACGCTQGWRKPEKLSHKASEGGSDAERRDDLAAAKTGTHSQGSKDYLPQKVQWTSLIFLYREFNKVVSGTHVISRMKQKSDHNNDCTRRHDADIWIRKIPGIKLADTLKDHAENDADCGTCDCDDDHFAACYDGQFRDIYNMK